MKKMTLVFVVLSCLVIGTVASTEEASTPWCGEFQQFSAFEYEATAQITSCGGDPQCCYDAVSDPAAMLGCFEWVIGQQINEWCSHIVPNYCIGYAMGGCEMSPPNFECILSKHKECVGNEYDACEAYFNNYDRIYDICISHFNAWLYVCLNGF